MVHAGHVLFNDGAFVQVSGHVVGGGTDELHATVVRLVIGLGAFEAGQKAVVNVDGAARQFLAQVVAQDLHVAGQHHQFGAFGFNHLISFGFCLCFGRCRDGDVVERHVVAGRQLVELAVVADDGANVQGQQTAFDAEQQVVQAMAFFADHQHRAHGLCGVVQRPLHLEAGGEGGKLLAQGVLLDRIARKLHTHEKQACVVVVVLGGFFDVALAFQQKARYRVNNALAVRARQVEDVCSHKARL